MSNKYAIMLCNHRENTTRIHSVCSNQAEADDRARWLNEHLDFHEAWVVETDSLAVPVSDLWERLIATVPLGLCAAFIATVFWPLWWAPLAGFAAGIAIGELWYRGYRMNEADAGAAAEDMKQGEEDRAA